MSQQAQTQIPEGQPEEVIGSGIAKPIVAQLKAREDLIGGSRSDLTQLQFFNSNGGWARLSSSVNTLTEKQTIDLASGKVSPSQAKGDHALAYNNVLSGGMTKLNTSNEPTSLGGGINTDKHNPANIDGRGFITRGDTKNSAYHNYDSIGFRPTPGITSVSIQSKGTYGALREAEVSITVWSLEDLEIVQALYLRPGYTMLLEWGHSLQLDSETKKLNKNIDYFKRFLQSKVAFKDIEEGLKEIKKDSSYNYDAMFGYVSNFNWSFRQDGGYDCTVKILSKGSVLESIAATFDPSTVYPAEQMRSSDGDKGKKERKSIFHKLFVEMEPLIRTYPSSGDAEVGLFRMSTSKHFRKVLNNFIAFGFSEIEDEGTGPIDDDDLLGVWIPLRVMLDVFNNYVGIQDNTAKAEKSSKTQGKKLTQFYTGEQDPDTNKQDFQKSAKYLTNEYHASIDPLVCVLPKAPKKLSLYTSEGKIVKWDEDLEDQDDSGVTSYGYGYIERKDFHKTVENAFKTKKLRGAPDDILNILVSGQYILDILEKMLNTQEDSDQVQSVDVVSFIKEVLGGINDALGSINDLDLTYVEEDDMFYIIDRKVTPKSKTAIPTLTLTGLSSTILNLDISSKISSNIGNMVSIAAQGSDGNTKDNVAPLLEWNRGLIDRHIPHKAKKNDQTGEQGKTKDERAKPEDKRLIQWANSYYDFWEEFNSNSWFDKGDYVRDLIPNLKGYHKEFCQKWVVDELRKAPKDPIPAPGTIPIELSFKTVGIAGLKIGQSFRVSPGVLPQNYTDNFGFIITGLSHSIENQKWTTDVKTQFYSLRLPDVEERLRQRRTAIGPQTPVEQQSAEEVPLPLQYDPAPEINQRRVGTQSPENTPVFKTRGINLRNSSKQDVLNLVQQGKLIEVGDANTNPNKFAGYLTTPRLLDGKFYLEKKAGEQFLLWMQELDSKAVPYSIASAVRFGTNTGGVAHGYGVAVDFGNLNALVGGAIDAETNLNARIKYKVYRDIAQAGIKYNWFNPWRLSDVTGKYEEIWHFEYWGPA